MSVYSIFLLEKEKKKAFGNKHTQNIRIVSWFEPFNGNRIAVSSLRNSLQL